MPFHYYFNKYIFPRWLRWSFYYVHKSGLCLSTTYDISESSNPIYPLWFFLQRGTWIFVKIEAITHLKIVPPILLLWFKDLEIHSILETMREGMIGGEREREKEWEKEIDREREREQIMKKMMECRRCYASNYRP